MTYQPVVVGTGLAGWRFLQSTLTKQRAAFDSSPSLQRPIEYFADNIALADRAEKLVSDRRLLDVALTAFGLEGDLNNKFFVKRVLEDGTLKSGALATRLADDRYVTFSKAFGYGDYSIPRVKLSDFPDEISQLFLAQSFEKAIGDQDEDIRLALNFERTFEAATKSDASVDTLWFRIMGNPPLRAVLEKALGLPASIGKLDIDQQLSIFKSRAERQLGSSNPKVLREDANRERIVEMFLLKAQLEDFSVSNSKTIALQMVQGAVLFQKGLVQNT